ncbi:zinc finger protein 708 [Ixodes scapularis]
MDEDAHLENHGGMLAYCLPLEGKWNGTFEVKKEQDEEPAVSTSSAWHCGDVGDPFISHGHICVVQTTSVIVKKEPEDVPSTSADDSVHSYNCGDMSEFPLQLEGYRAGGFSVKKEPEDVPPTLAESVLPDDGSSMSECPLQLESHGDSITAVKEEPTDVERLSFNRKESNSSFAHERCDQPQQEEQDEPKSYDCCFCPFSSFIKSKKRARRVARDPFDPLLQRSTAAGKEARCPCKLSGITPLLPR